MVLSLLPQSVLPIIAQDVYVPSVADAALQFLHDIVQLLLWPTQSNTLVVHSLRLAISGKCTNKESCLFLIRDFHHTHQFGEKRVRRVCGSCWGRPGRGEPLLYSRSLFWKLLGNDPFGKGQKLFIARFISMSRTPAQRQRWTCGKRIRLQQSAY